MAQLIEYHMPAGFISPQAKWVAPSARGKVLEFQSAVVNQPTPQIGAMALEYTRVVSAPPR
jgi:hypothetical protein